MALNKVFKCTNFKKAPVTSKGNTFYHTRCFRLVWVVWMSVNMFPCSAVQEPWRACCCVHIWVVACRLWWVYCLFAKSALLLRDSHYETLHVKSLAPVKKVFADFCFAFGATCWQQRWKTPPCRLIHLSIPHNSLLKGWTFLCLCVTEGWLVKKYIRELSV